MFYLLTRIFKRIVFEIKVRIPTWTTEDEVNAVFNFYRHYQDYRSLQNCAQATGFSLYKCARLKRKLYKDRRLGLYYFAAHTPPQKFMLERILKDNPGINNKSNILEIGPGDNPIFSYKIYENWYGVDKNFFDGVIKFKDNKWAKGKYPSGRILQGGFENLTNISHLNSFIGQFDLVVASHAYEHVLSPLQALRESFAMLRLGGRLILFVPNGYSDDKNSKDPTHTLYINPGMMREFFSAVGGFDDILIEDFRPNADFIISAQKS